MFTLKTAKEIWPNILYQGREIIRVLLIEDNPGDARLVTEMLVDARQTSSV